MGRVVKEEREEKQEENRKELQHLVQSKQDSSFLLEEFIDF